MTAVWPPLQAVMDAAQRIVPDPDYPMWVCADCGQKYGYRPCGIATWHEDTCGICGHVTGVTEPRDFGGLRGTWLEEHQSSRK